MASAWLPAAGRWRSVVVVVDGENGEEKSKFLLWPLCGIEGNGNVYEAARPV